MQHSHNKNPIRFCKIEHHVFADLKPSQAFPDRIAGPAHRRISRQKIQTVFELREVTVSLPQSPFARRVSCDLIDVIFGF